MHGFELEDGVSAAFADALVFFQLLRVAHANAGVVQSLAQKDGPGVGWVTRAVGRGATGKILWARAQRTPLICRRYAREFGCGDADCYKSRWLYGGVLGGVGIAQYGDFLFGLLLRDRR